METDVCPHCGEPHPKSTSFCPNTGKALARVPLPPPNGRAKVMPDASDDGDAAIPVDFAADDDVDSSGDASGSAGATGGPGTGATATTRATTRATTTATTTGATPTGAADAAAMPELTFDIPAEKGVLDLLQEAFRLYRKNAKTFLAVAALLLVPGAIVNSCAHASILGPTVAATTVAIDPVTHAPIASNPAIGGVASVFLGLLASALTGFLLYGLLVPLTEGALTIAAADRTLGGNASWKEIWRLLARRLPALLSALIPAALLTGVGYLFLVVPGLVLSFLFAFVTPVVLIEGRSGVIALQRSYELVRADWLRVLLMLIAFGLVYGLAAFVSGLLVPNSLWGAELARELLAMVVLPVPMIAGVLLYFDIRRRSDGFDEAALRVELDSLRR